MARPNQEGPCGGGTGGTPYEIAFNTPLVAINVHGNVVVDNIQLVFAESGGSPEDFSAGGGGGNAYPIFGVPPGVTLVGVKGSYRDVVEAIAFIFSDGTVSPTYGTTTPPGSGTQQATAFVLTIPPGATLFSVFGNAGSYINNIGLNYNLP